MKAIYSILPWVIVSNPGTDAEKIIGEYADMETADIFKKKVKGVNVDVMKRLPSGELTTEF